MQSLDIRDVLRTAPRASLPFGLAALALLLAAAPAAAGEGWPKPAALATAADVPALFEALTRAEECAPVDEHTCGEPCETSWAAGQRLGGLIVRDDASFDAFAPLLREQFRAALDLHDRRRLLGFLAGCPSERTVALAWELFGTSPEVFAEPQLVAFAAMGSSKFEQLLVARVERGPCDSIVPAAYLAFHGNDVGATALRRAAEARIDPESVDDALLAAAALDRLGAGDPSSVQDAVLLRVHDSVLSALDAGELKRARELALGAQVVCERLAQQSKSAYGFHLNNLETDVAWQLRSDAGKLANAERVFEVIEEITPIS